jgi:histone H3/H4
MSNTLADQTSPAAAPAPAGMHVSCNTLLLQACEMFILEMTLRSWAHAEENRRRTLQRSDVAAAISRNEIFDFLVSLS